MLVTVLNSSFNSSKAYGRQEAFELLGCCSLAVAELVDDEGKPCKNKEGESSKEFIWLSANGTTWLRASWNEKVQIAL